MAIYLIGDAGRDYCFSECAHIELCLPFLSCHPLAGPTYECRGTQGQEERPNRWDYHKLKSQLDAVERQNTYVLSRMPMVEKVYDYIHPDKKAAEQRPRYDF